VVQLFELCGPTPVGSLRNGPKLRRRAGPGCNSASGCCAQPLNGLRHPRRKAPGKPAAQKAVA